MLQPLASLVDIVGQRGMCSQPSVAYASSIVDTRPIGLHRLFRWELLLLCENVDRDGMTNDDRLVPLLVLRAAADAIDFYVRAFGANEIVRYENKIDGTISHADLAIDGVRFSVTEEARAWSGAGPCGSKPCGGRWRSVQPSSWASRAEERSALPAAPRLHRRRAAIVVSTYFARSLASAFVAPAIQS
jgi:hypothetical protein